MPNGTPNTGNSLGNFFPNNNNGSNNSAMSAQQRMAQGGVGLFNQQGLMNGMRGNASPGMMGNAGNMNNVSGLGAMNNMGGMANNMNLGNAAGNFNALSAGGMNPNAANFNNFNASDLMRLQLQQQQQQQMQQQMQLQQMQQMQQMQMQGGGGLNNPKFGLMAAHNQNQFGKNFQSLMGRNQGGGLPGQANFQQNPFLGQLMMNQQQGMLSQLGAAGLAGNQGNAMGAVGANNPISNAMFSRDANRRMRGGVIEPFPEKLHRLLIEVETCGRADVISFVANGRAFAIHKADVFFKEIVPLYFRQSRLSSFKRQLNLYGFELINTGPARGGYYHEMFVKERPELCRQMRRVAIKVSPKKNDKNNKKGDADDSDEKAEKGEEEVAADEAKTEEPSSTEDAAKADSEEAKEESTKEKTEEQITSTDETTVEKTEVEATVEKTEVEDEKEAEAAPKKEETDNVEEPAKK